MSQTNDLLKEISEKLDKMLKLLALSAVKDLKKEQEKIVLLDSLGFKATEIAKFLNKTQENVNTVLNSIRRKTEKSVKAEPTKVEAEKASTELKSESCKE